MADSASPDGPPPFEEVFRADDVEQGIFGTILQTREPATASAIAECDPKTARKYLSWFADLGIVTRYAGHPATYERNGAYFEWRRINQLDAEQPVEDLQERARELASRIDEYEERYDAEMPADVDAVALAEARDDRRIDERVRGIEVRSKWYSTVFSALIPRSNWHLQRRWF